MRPDYFVPFKSEETIASIASKWRQAARVDHNYCFNLTDFISKTLSKFYLQKGKLEIHFFSQNFDGPPAYVKYNPLRLYVDKEIWRDSQLGEPMARFILAHEIGHIVLHDHHAKSFSANPELRLKFAMKEYGSEWQADTFGSHFLVSDEQVSDFTTDTELAITCGIPIQLAAERFFNPRLGARRNSSYTGEVCGECGNFTLMRNGICLKCDTCGGTSGYS